MPRGRRWRVSIPGAVDAGDNLHPEKRGKIFTDRSSQDAGECRQCPVRSEPVHGDDPLQRAKPADLEPDDGAAASRHDHYKGIDNKAWRNLTQGGGIRYAGSGIAFPACTGRQSGDNGGAGIPIFLAVAAFSVDTSSLFLERRQLQSMADFAAVAGAASLSQANDAVLRQLRANGLDPVLMTGAYDPSVVNGKTDNKTRVWVEKGNYFPDKKSCG